MKPPGPGVTLDHPAKPIEMLRVIYTEKIPPYNTGEAATWPAPDARRLVILGVAQPYGFPDEPEPPDGGPVWSLSRSEEGNRRTLNAYREHTKSDEEKLQEAARADEIETQTARRIAEDVVKLDPEDVEKPA